MFRCLRVFGFGRELDFGVLILDCFVFWGICVVARCATSIVWVCLLGAEWVWWALFGFDCGFAILIGFIWVVCLRLFGWFLLVVFAGLLCLCYALMFGFWLCSIGLSFNCLFSVLACFVRWYSLGLGWM